MESVAVYPEELLFEPELVVRGSTGPAPLRSSPQHSSPQALATTGRRCEYRGQLTGRSVPEAAISRAG